MNTTNTIWQAMQRGDWYLAHAAELQPLRERAIRLCWLLNQSQRTHSERKKVISALLPHAFTTQIGKHFQCDFGVNIICDGPLIINNNVVILDHSKVTIGANVTIEDSVVIATVTHPLDEQKRKAGWQRANAITIGDNVMLGARCSVLPGANIPSHTHIAEDRVVTSSTFAQ